MLFRSLSMLQKSWVSAAATLIAAGACWAGLVAAGLHYPVWAVITVFIVSAPDLATTAALAHARLINTVVGCIAGLAALQIFGYSPVCVLVTAGLTIILATSLERYPANWRLAPVTVVILMDAGRQASSIADQMRYAFLRAGEIVVGCIVALLLAHLLNRFRLTPTPTLAAAPEPPASK